MAESPMPEMAENPDPSQESKYEPFHRVISRQLFMEHMTFTRHLSPEQEGALKANLGALHGSEMPAAAARTLVRVHQHLPERLWNADKPELADYAKKVLANLESRRDKTEEIVAAPFDQLQWKDRFLDDLGTEWLLGMGFGPTKRVVAVKGLEEGVVLDYESCPFRGTVVQKIIKRQGEPEETVEVEIKHLKLGEEVRMAGERCMLSEIAMTRELVWVTGPAKGKDITFDPSTYTLLGPNSKVRKIVKKSDEPKEAGSKQQSSISNSPTEPPDGC